MGLTPIYSMDTPDKDDGCSMLNGPGSVRFYHTTQNSVQIKNEKLILEFST